MSGTSSATIQSNRGRLQSDSVAYGGGGDAYFKQQPALADSEVYFEFLTDATRNEQYLAVCLRSDGTFNSTVGSYPKNGYFLEVQESAGTAQLRRGVSDSFTTLGTAFTVTSGGLTNNATYAIRIRVEGARIRWKVWSTSSAEPAAWTQDYTDATPYATAGKTSWTVQNGGTNTARYFDLDNVSINDLASTALSGTAALSGSGTLTAAGAPGVTRAAALAGSGSLTATGAAAATGLAALSGTGTLAGSASPSVTRAAALSGAGTLAATGRAAILSAVASLSGAGNLTTTGTPATIGNGSLTGTGQLATGGTPSIRGTATLAGAGQLTAAAQAPNAADLSGTGQLAITGTPNLAGATALTGTGALTTLGRVDLVVAVNLNGIGSLTATGRVLSGYRDIALTLGAITGHPLQVAGVTGNALTVRALTGHQLEPRTLTGHTLAPSSPTGHPLHAGPVRN